MHSKLKHDIIIDTDRTDNDLRAISFLLAHPGITVKAILLSNGKFHPDQGGERIRNLLHEFKADTIPFGYRSEFTTTNPHMRNRNKGIPGQKTTGFLTGILQATSEYTTILCLGPLTNVNREIQENPG